MTRVRHTLTRARLKRNDMIKSLVGKINSNLRHEMKFEKKVDKNKKARKRRGKEYMSVSRSDLIIDNPG